MFKIETFLSTILFSTVSMGVEYTAYDRYIDQDLNVIETFLVLLLEKKVVSHWL
jgi:hypothetical protein